MTAPWACPKRNGDEAASAATVSADMLWWMSAPLAKVASKVERAGCVVQVVAQPTRAQPPFLAAKTAPSHTPHGFSWHATASADDGMARRPTTSIVFVVHAMVTRMPARVEFTVACTPQKSLHPPNATLAAWPVEPLLGRGS